MRNALETYVYDNRASLDTYGDKAKFIEDAEWEKYLEHLNGVESWLYADGEQASKDEYQNKLSELKVVGNVIDKRYRFHDQYNVKAKQLEDVLQDTLNHESLVLVDSHITDEEKKQLTELVFSTNDWWKNVK